MKNNSIRLRLTQTELARFAETGTIEETIEFGGAAKQNFVYALQTANGAKEIRATFENNRITVFVPQTQADEWTTTARVGIENVQSIGDGAKTLRLLIEKDFACLEPRAGDGDADAFPHPLEAKVC